MIPYILALVFLIAIILWQVYSQNEAFASATDISGSSFTLPTFESNKIETAPTLPTGPPPGVTQPSSTTSTSGIPPPPPPPSTSTKTTTTSGIPPPPPSTSTTTMPSTTSTTNSAISDEMMEYIKKGYAFITRLKTVADKATGKTFTPIIKDTSEAMAFGKSDMPKNSEEFVAIVNNQIDFLEKKINKFKENPTDTKTIVGLKGVTSSSSPTEEIVSTLEKIYDRSISPSNSDIAAMRNIAMTRPPTTTTTTSTGEPKLMVNIYDLWGALGPFSSDKSTKSFYSSDGTIQNTGTGVVSSLTGGTDTKTTAADAAASQTAIADVTKAKEQPVTCSQPATTDKQSELLSKELEERLSKNIKKQIKDELMSQHQLQGAIDDMSPYAPCDLGLTNEGIEQGSLFQQMRPQLMRQETAPIFMKQPNINMNDYIRKDSIPCAKCNLSA